MIYRCYEVTDTQEVAEVSNLIKKSQILLCVAIGLIATITIQVLTKPLENFIISEVFKLPRQMLLQSYLVQMRLSAVILTKMEQSVRQSNSFAKQLQDRLWKAKPDLPDFSY